MLRTVSLVLVGCVTCLMGCANSGPETYSVTGTVTFNGQPIPTGDITFESDSGDASADAGRIVDGKYECKARPGRKKVKITASREKPGKTTKGAMGETIAEREEYIPLNYNSETELTAEIDQSNDNKIHFELKGTP